jgi:hypothetical protein
MIRRRALRVGLTAAFIVALVASALWPGRPRQTRILGGWDSDASAVVLTVASCNANLSFRVRESEEAVAALVWKRYDTMDDCADGLRIPLESPLGDRVVIDLSNWEVVEVIRTDE